MLPYKIKKKRIQIIQNLKNFVKKVPIKTSMKYAIAIIICFLTISNYEKVCIDSIFLTNVSNIPTYICTHYGLDKPISL